MEFLHANSLAVCREPLTEVMDKYVRWNYAVEGKSLRVNFDEKRYAVIIWEKSGVSKVDPCGACGERVGCNSIQCMKCQR